MGAHVINPHQLSLLEPEQPRLFDPDDYPTRARPMERPRTIGDERREADDEAVMRQQHQNLFHAQYGRD